MIWIHLLLFCPAVIKDQTPTESRQDADGSSTSQAQVTTSNACQLAKGQRDSPKAYICPPPHFLPVSLFSNPCAAVAPVTWLSSPDTIRQSQVGYSSSPGIPRQVQVGCSSRPGYGIAEAYAEYSGNSRTCSLSCQRGRRVMVSTATHGLARHDRVGGGGEDHPAKWRLYHPAK